MFKKYKSIENHYREKHILDMLQHNPVYHTCRYVAQEKIHGANFQIRFERGDDFVSISYGKRSGVITHDENFYNHTAVVNKPHIQALQESICEQMHSGVLSEVNTVFLYGEFYGGNVQDGVDYGPDKDIIFFDIMVDSEYYTVKDFYEFMNLVNGSSLTVPLVADFKNLDDALKFDVEGKITIVGEQKEGNHWEGVVIKPWDVIARNSDDEQVLFYTKKKCEDFKDIQRKKKSIDTRAALPTELLKAQDAFSEYLTEQRLNDVFSKEGVITDQKDIGKYIRFVMEDAKEDFFKDYMDLFNDVPDKHKAKVFGITGKIVSKMLFKYI